MEHDGGALERGLLHQDVGHTRVERRMSSSLSRTSIDDQVRVTVETRKLDYFVGPAKDPKQILHDVSVRFEPGELACMMGPSGAGKTTLLSCLLGNASGRVQGSIRVNGMEGPPKDFKSVSKLIPQEDVLLTSFTVRETFFYQSELVLPESMTREEKDARIAKVLNELNLASCLDVRIGNVEERGISGGQRKRVSIGMDLLSNPACLFVDEPTSGLDSKTAEDVVQILRDLAHGNNAAGYQRTIITTIHQPSYRIFSLFDKVVLLTKGRVAYQGGHQGLEDLFEGLGMSTPPKENPADHYMRMLQDEEAAPLLWAAHAQAEKAARLEDTSDGSHSTEPDAEACSATTFEDDDRDRSDGAAYRGSSRCSWALKPCRALFSRLSGASAGDAGYDELAGGAAAHSALSTAMREQQKRLENVPKYPVSTRRQFWTLLRRSTYDALKNPNKFLRTIALKAAVGVLIGVVWWHAASPPRLQKLFPIEGAMFCILMNSCIDTLAMTIIVFPTQRSLLIREYKNGSYSLLAFYPALMLSMGLLSVLYALTMTVPIYLMVELQLSAEKFVYFLLIVVFMTCIGNALGVIVGATSKDLVEAQNKLMPTLAPLVLFSGYVIPLKDMHQVFKIFYHISFFQFALNGMQLNQLAGLDFDLSVWGIDVKVHGDDVLRNYFGLDPDTHKVSDYVLIMLAYAVGITCAGYWIIKFDLTRKRG